MNWEARAGTCHILDGFISSRGDKSDKVGVASLNESIAEMLRRSHLCLRQVKARDISSSRGLISMLIRTARFTRQCIALPLDSATSHMLHCRLDRAKARPFTFGLPFVLRKKTGRLSLRATHSIQRRALSRFLYRRRRLSPSSC